MHPRYVIIFATLAILLLGVQGSKGPLKAFLSFNNHGHYFAEVDVTFNAKNGSGVAKVLSVLRGNERHARNIMPGDAKLFAHIATPTTRFNLGPVAATGFTLLFNSSIVDVIEFREQYNTTTAPSLTFVRAEEEPIYNHQTLELTFPLGVPVTMSFHNYEGHKVFIHGYASSPATFRKESVKQYIYNAATTNWNASQGLSYNSALVQELGFASDGSETVIRKYKVSTNDPTDVHFAKYADDLKQYTGFGLLKYQNKQIRNKIRAL